MLKIIFQTMIELFGYPGKKRWQWRRFLEDHKDVLTDVEYDASIMFLTFEAHNQFLIDLDPRAKPALALLGQLTFRFGLPGRERRQWLRFIDEHRDFLTTEEYDDLKQRITNGSTILEDSYIRWENDATSVQNDG